ncbi:MAG: hypothetical protein V3V20_04830 [Algisphaera sp.]
MNGRIIMMAGSLLLAGGVVTAAVLWGGGAEKPAAPAAQDTPLAPLDLSDLEGADLNTSDLNTSGGPLALEAIEGFEIFQDDGKIITRLTGAEANPRENFVADIRLPQAQITFAPNRVIQINAATGTFYYPGNEPQRGEFHRDTVITFYESPEGTTADLFSNRHVQFRLYLDESTRFDREQGQVRTEGPVRLVGRDIDFSGSGLSLTFNPGQRRIEQMIIEHGHELRLAAGSQETSPQLLDADTNPAKPQSTSSPATAKAKTQNASNSNTSAEDPSAAQKENHGQAYLVSLNDSVNVTVSGDGTTLQGNTLQGLFTVRSNPNNTASGESSPVTSAGPPTAIQASIVADASPSASDLGDAATASVATDTSIAPPTNNPSDPRALRLAQPDDIVVTWKGRMTLMPHDGPAPEGFTLNSQSNSGPNPQIMLEGSPARVTRTDNQADAQTLEAARVGYHDALGRVWAESDGPDAPLVLQAPDFGRLTARRLELEQRAGHGVVHGPGVLETQNGQLNVAFANQLNLAFRIAPQAEAPTETATTSNDAKNSDDFAAGFTQLENATFSGAVRVNATQADGTPELDLDAEQLSITFRPAQPSDNPQPTELHATGTPETPVSARQPGTRFTANQLTVDLAPPALAPPAANADTKSDDALTRVAVTRLRAMGQVNIQLDQGDAHLTAHALDADPAAKRLELFGQNDTPATLTRRGAKLSGVHLVLLEAQQTAQAFGPGRFRAPVDPAKPQDHIEITWTQAMTFNNQTGQARFGGQVQSRSISSTGRTSLDTHELSIAFVPQNLADANDDGDDDDQTTQTKPQASTLDIRRVHALADPANSDSQVNFTTQTFAKKPVAPNTPPLTAFTLISRELLFINQPANLNNQTRIDDHTSHQTIEVPHRGRMLLSDNRTAPASNDSSVTFAGAGLTAFAWEGRLALDALHNDLRIEGDVIMAHDPQGDAPPVKLETQVLTADLTETGGLNAFANGDAPTAQLRRVEARGNIRVSQKDTRVLADHLDFTTTRNSIIFTAEPGKLCQLRQEGQAGAQTNAKALTWDLTHGVFTAEGVGGGVVPIE